MELSVLTDYEEIWKLANKLAKKECGSKCDKKEIDTVRTGHIAVMLDMYRPRPAEIFGRMGVERRKNTDGASAFGNGTNSFGSK